MKILNNHTIENQNLIEVKRKKIYLKKTDARNENQNVDPRYSEYPLEKYILKQVDFSKIAAKKRQGSLNKKKRTIMQKNPNTL